MSTGRLLISALAAMALAACNPPIRYGTDSDAGVVVDAGLVTDAYFKLRTDPVAVTVGQNGITTLNVLVTRTNETGTITFSIADLPAGVTATFSPPSTTGSATLLTLTTTTATPIAFGNFTLSGVGTRSTSVIHVGLTVTAPVETLLIDDDLSDNNKGDAEPVASPSDVLFKDLLTKANVPYNVYVVAKDANGPTFEQLKSYRNVIWYCGSEYLGAANVNTLSSADEVALRAYLDLGSRKVSIFASSYLYGQGTNNNWNAVQGEWLRFYIGAAGVAWDRLNDNTYTVNGVGVLAGTTMAVANGTPIRTLTDPINPAVGTDTFFTALMDADMNGTEEQASIAVGRRGVGTLGSSKVTFFSFAFENLVELQAPNRKLDVFQKVLAY